MTSASLIVTSNKGFADVAETFQYHVLGSAILDRLLHHATSINIKVKADSYRHREGNKANFLGPPNLRRARASA